MHGSFNNSAISGIRLHTLLSLSPIQLQTPRLVKSCVAFLDPQNRKRKWASSRNKIECAIHALNELRKEYILLLHSNMNDKEFYVNIAKHGVIRRVGTIYDVYDDGPAALFQTRKR